MAEVVGHNAYIGLGREAIWGTAATITDHVRIMSQGLKRNVPYVLRESLGSPEAIGVIRGTKSGAGPIKVEWLYQGMECFLAYLFGAPTINADTPVAGATEWIFTPQATIYTNDGLTIETSFGTAAQGGWAYVWDGGKINSATFTQEKDKTLQATLETTTQGIAYDASPTTPTYPTDYPCLETELTFEVDDGASTNITNFNFAAANNLSVDRAKLGSGEILEQLRGDLMGFTGSWAGDYLATTYQVGMESGTAYKLEFNYTTAYYITATTPYQLLIEFPEAYILGDQPGVDGPGIIPETNNFLAVRNNSAGYALKITLHNARTALPAES